jgi:hypothetical protein
MAFLLYKRIIVHNRANHSISYVCCLFHRKYYNIWSLGNHMKSLQLEGNRFRYDGE